jgi:hypothetical protein
MRDLLIGVGSDPDKCLWGLAGVADSILSKISELGEANQFPKEVVFADWSNFAYPFLHRAKSLKRIAPSPWLAICFR